VLVALGVAVFVAVGGLGVAVLVGVDDGVGVGGTGVLVGVDVAVLVGVDDGVGGTGVLVGNGIGVAVGNAVKVGCAVRVVATEDWTVVSALGGTGCVDRVSTDAVVAGGWEPQAAMITGMTRNKSKNFIFIVMTPVQKLRGGGLKNE